jgi:hypothetical protein
MYMYAQLDIYIYLCIPYILNNLKVRPEELAEIDMLKKEATIIIKGPVEVYIYIYVYMYLYVHK